MIHELKIWPPYYRYVKDGVKNFEVRVNDRNFRTGDQVILKEWDPDIIEVFDNSTGSMMVKPKGYTQSKRLFFLIGFVLPIDDKRVVFSLLPAIPPEGFK